MNNLSVLLITNLESTKEIIQKEICKEFELQLYNVTKKEEYEKILDGKKIDLVILDYEKQCFNDLDSFFILQEKDIDIPFIIISDHVSEQKIVEFIKKGINNYVSKNNLSHINEIIKLELNEKNKTFYKKDIINFIEKVFKSDVQYDESIIIDYFIKITESELAYLYEYDSNKKKFYLKRAYGKKSFESTKDFEVLEEKDFLKDIVENKNVIVINEYPQNENGYLIKNPKIKRLFALPITIENKGGGVLILCNKKENYEKDKNIILLLNLVCKIFREKKLEEKLVENEKYYRAIVNDMPALICRFLPDGTLTFVNNAYCEYFDEPKEKLIGQSFTPLIPDEDKEYVIEQSSSLSYEKPSISYNHRVILKDGTIRWMNWIDHAIFDENKNIIEYQSIGRDITDEIESKKRLENLLAEKEILLKEVHHRVKNTLQIITSLIELNKNYPKNNIDEILQDIKSRIRSMALIYEHIYQSENFVSIDLSHYLYAIIDKTCYNYNFKKSLDKKIELEEINISLDIAMPIALITNELLTNIFIHAFKDTAKPYLEVELKKREENRYSLKIKDNGSGLPEDIDPYSDKTFGFMLINLLVNQIKGEMIVKREKGTEIIINFSDNMYKRSNLLTK